LTKKISEGKQGIANCFKKRKRKTGHCDHQHKCGCETPSLPQLEATFVTTAYHAPWVALKLQRSRALNCSAKPP